MGLPAVWETRIQSLCWEDPLEKEVGTHSNILAWRIPWTWDHKESDTTERLHFNLFYSSLIVSLCWAKASSWKRKLIFPMIFENHRYRYLELQIMISMPWYDHSSRAQHPRMEVKWALGSITMNKASRGDGISAELFHILKDDALKVLYSVCQQVWKTQQWVFIGLGKINFHSNPKERQCQRMFKLLHNCIHLTR